MGEDITRFLTLFQETGLGFVVDDSLPGEPRAVLVAPAFDLQAATVNAMIRLSGGVLYVALGPSRVSALRLVPMDSLRQPPPRPAVPAGGAGQVAFAVCSSVEAREGVSTGISAADRAHTVRIIGDPFPNPRRLVRPGHVFPVATRPGGVLARGGLPEAALDVVLLAGGTDAAAFMEVVDTRGEFPSAAALESAAAAHGLPVVSVDRLVRHRLAAEPLVKRVAEANLPTGPGGAFRVIVYSSSVHVGDHVALVRGEVSPDVPVLIRVQPERTFTDVFGGGPSQTGAQIRRSLAMMSERGSGVFVYLRRPEEGVLSDQVRGPGAGGASSTREYGIGAQILRDLGVRKMELLTTSGSRPPGLSDSGLASFGLEVVADVPLTFDGPTGGSRFGA